MTAILTMLVLRLAPTAELEAGFFWVDLLAGAAVAALLAGLVRHPQGMGVRLLSSKVTRWLGQSSYSLYLIRAHRRSCPVRPHAADGIVGERTLRSDARYRPAGGACRLAPILAGLRTPLHRTSLAARRPRRVLEPTRSRLNNRGDEDELPGHEQHGTRTFDPDSMDTAGTESTSATTLHIPFRTSASTSSSPPKCWTCASRSFLTFWERMA